MCDDVAAIDFCHRAISAAMLESPFECDTPFSFLTTSPQGLSASFIFHQRGPGALLALMRWDDDAIDGD